MKKALLFLVTMLTINGSLNLYAQHARESKIASKIYLKRLNYIQKQIKKTTFGGKKFFTIIRVLEDLTGIPSFTIDPHSYDGGFICPIDDNIFDWRSWYDLNKNNLYYNRKTDSLYVLGSVKPIIKDPNKVYQKYLSLIDLNYSDEVNLNLDIYNFSLDRLQQLTGYRETRKVDVWDDIYPTQYDIKFFKIWLNECEDFLKWDPVSFSIVIE